jgi:hypothetical protein
MNAKHEPKKSVQDQENNSHIARKKKAVQSQFQRKNLKDIVHLMNEEDEDLAETYARYVK